MVQGWELVKAEKNNVALFVGWKQSCGEDGGNEDRIESYKTVECLHALTYINYYIILDTENPVLLFFLVLK